MEYIWIINYGLYWATTDPKWDAHPNRENAEMGTWGFISKSL
jgi:hypothetical protein